MPNGITKLKPGELPPGAKRDPKTGKIWYPGGIKGGTSGGTQLPSSFEETLGGIQGGLADLMKRIQTEGVTGAGGEMLIKPTETPKLPGLGDEVKDRALGGGGEEEEKTPGEKLLEDLTTKLTAYGEKPTLTEEKKRLEEEKGVLGLRETVGSFEEEMGKTQTLLDQLEEDITQRTREYLVSEPQRRRVLAAEQEPLIKQLGIQERGYTATKGKLERTEADILTELGLIEKEKTEPLDLLEREINIRKNIKELTDTKIPGVVSSTFNEEGDMTIVTQDPTTGAFSTQTLKGIGEKAQQYQSITSSTDDAGNLTIIGVTREGKSEILGTFKGVGKVTETEGKLLSPAEVKNLQEQNPNAGIEYGDTQASATDKIKVGGGKKVSAGVSVKSTEIRSAVNALPVGQQDSGFAAIQTFKNAKDIVDLLNKGVSTGPLSGMAVGGVKLFGKQIIPGTQAMGWSSSEENQLVAATTAFTANFIKAISGATVTDKEREFLMNALPTINDQEQVIVDRLKTLMKTIKNKWELQLNLDFDQYPDEIPRIEEMELTGKEPAKYEINFKF